MSGTLRVRWTIRSTSGSCNPIIRCSRCNADRVFESSGKFRLNANGARLDAWLVYRCRACSKSWNRPIFERKRIAEIDRAMLDALQANDSALAGRLEADRDGLARWTFRFETDASGTRIEKTVMGAVPSVPSRLEIAIASDGAIAERTDRLLAAGLCLPRGRVTAMARSGDVALAGREGKWLNRPLRHGDRVDFRLDRLADRDAIVAASIRRLADESEGDGS